MCNSSTENGSLEENYFALVPTADPGTLRPIVSSASPIPGSYNININDGGPVSAPTTLTIANRDTTVDANSIVFKLNGISVPIVKTVQANGVQVDWKFADTPGAALISASLAFTRSTHHLHCDEALSVAIGIWLVQRARQAIVGGVEDRACSQLRAQGLTGARQPHPDRSRVGLEIGGPKEKRTPSGCVFPLVERGGRV